MKLLCGWLLLDSAAAPRDTGVQRGRPASVWCLRSQTFEEAALADILPWVQ